MPRRDTSPIFHCLRCQHEIVKNELRHMVRLSNGVMHGTCHVEMTRQVNQMIAAAMAEGTHSVQKQEFFNEHK